MTETTIELITSEIANVESELNLRNLQMQEATDGTLQLKIDDLEEQLSNLNQDLNS